MMLNLIGEVGEFAGKVAKSIRKEHFKIQGNELAVGRNIDDVEDLGESLTELKSEAGDILWQLSGLCKVMGWPLEDVAQYNLDKLANRKQTGTIITHKDH